MEERAQKNLGITGELIIILTTAFANSTNLSISPDDVFAPRFASPRCSAAAEPYYHGATHALSRGGRPRADGAHAELLRAAGFGRLDFVRGHGRGSHGGGLSGHAGNLVGGASDRMEKNYCSGPSRRWAHRAAALARRSRIRSILLEWSHARRPKRDRGGG